MLERVPNQPVTPSGSIGVERYRADDRVYGLSWDDLGAGAPTIIAFARLCSNALAADAPAEVELSEEARAILFAAKVRGVIEIKGSNNAFDSVDRFLSVCVELDADTVMLFKNKADPQFTIRMLDGFRQLCAAGYVMHHLFREFSLTRLGFSVAKTIERESVESILAIASELDRTQW